MSAAPIAVIIAGGFGTRLLPLTQNRPKHLLEVAGVPFLEHQIVKLAAAGITQVVLATSYHADLFEPVLGDGSKYGLKLSYVQEAEPLGTGGAIRNVLSALGDDPDRAVLILNGDVVSGHDLSAQLADFESNRFGEQIQVSLHLVPVPDARAFGCVPTDPQGRVLDFVEKSANPITNQINAGCYIFRQRVVAGIPSNQVVSVERETFPNLVAAKALVVGFVAAEYWRDVGTPEALVQTSAEIVQGIGHSPAFIGPVGEFWAAVDADVHPTAKINAGSALSAGVRVAENAVVTGSVLLPGAVVHPGAIVIDSVLGWDAQVAAGVKLSGVTVADQLLVTESASQVKLKLADR